MSGLSPARVIAIDWSGAVAAAAQRRGICAAVAELGSARAGANANEAKLPRPQPAPFPHPFELQSVHLLNGRLRSEVEHWLLGFALRQEPVVVGLDFSFSYPAWFLRELDCGSAPEFWALAAAEGERWLREPHPHFWGRRKGIGPPPEHRAPGWLGYRRCERAAAASTGRLPLSSFQIGGAGAVGTGTLRGLPMLLRLRAAGWSVWPFDPPRLPMLVEIYPRVLTGPVVKSSAAARAQYLLAARFHNLAPETRALAEASEDVFDALISALAMREHAASFASLTQAEDEVTRLEGSIWRPPFRSDRME